MQNWEVLQKKISEMSKDAFITFAKEKLYCDTVRYMLDVNVECGRCKYRYESGSADCKKVLLEDEYQPPKQEKWIVHRTLRTKGVETYVSYKYIVETYKYFLLNKDNEMLWAYEEQCMAQRFSEEEAIKIRDELNKDRVGKQYLWVISKVEK